MNPPIPCLTNTTLGILVARPATVCRTEMRTTHVPNVRNASTIPPALLEGATEPCTKLCQKLVRVQSKQNGVCSPVGAGPPELGESHLLMRNQKHSETVLKVEDARLPGCVSQLLVIITAPLVPWVMGCPAPAVWPWLWLWSS